MSKKYFPTKMKIGFRDYIIRKPSKKEQETRAYIGMAVMEHNEIRLREKVCPDEQKVTLFHEYAHAKIYDSGMGVGMPLDREEQWCQFFSGCMMELVRDPTNWKILQWAHEVDRGSGAPEDVGIEDPDPDSEIEATETTMI